MFNPGFCARCYRVRITSDGKLRPCLMRDDGLVDLLTPMQNGASDAGLMGIITGSVRARRPYWDSSRK
jgi:cyclic pyranopterin phosphate synthase